MSSKTLNAVTTKQSLFTSAFLVDLMPLLGRQNIWQCLTGEALYKALWIKIMLKSKWPLIFQHKGLWHIYGRNCWVPSPKFLSRLHELCERWGDIIEFLINYSCNNVIFFQPFQRKSWCVRIVINPAVRKKEISTQQGSKNGVVFMALCIIN